MLNLTQALLLRTCLAVCCSILLPTLRTGTRTAAIGTLLSGPAVGARGLDWDEHLLLLSRLVPSGCRRRQQSSLQAVSSQRWTGTVSGR